MQSINYIVSRYKKISLALWENSRLFKKIYILFKIALLMTFFKTNILLHTSQIQSSLSTILNQLSWKAAGHPVWINTHRGTVGTVSNRICISNINCRSSSYRHDIVARVRGKPVLLHGLRGEHGRRENGWSVFYSTMCRCRGWTRSLPSRLRFKWQCWRPQAG